MLTRLEVDGFKNLIGTVIDFGPYTCIAGPNAVGKSNLFDAIEFLSLIADNSFLEAAQKLRSAGQRPDDPRVLFWYGRDGEPRNMKLAAEMIVPSKVRDDFGVDVSPTSTFLRYEVELAYVEPAVSAPGRLGAIRLVREDLNYISKAEARSRLGWKHTAAFRNSVVANKRFGKGYISTEVDLAGPSVQVHQDGGSRGPARRSSTAPRTIVSTTNTADDPTILAARREMQQWRKLALEPSAMRSPDSVMSNSGIGSDGSHLAAALFRMADAHEDVYSRVASTSSALTDVRAVGVDFDATRDLLTLQASVGSGPFLPARALSDGTLRFLALSVIEADPEFGGLICMEEPENGIHPAKIGAMVELLRSLAVDAEEPVGDENPLRQVMVNTHSPRFVAAQERADLLLALPIALSSPDGPITSVSFVPMAGSWRSGDSGFGASKALVADYLTKPDGALAELDYPEREITELD